MTQPFLDTTLSYYVAFVRVAAERPRNWVSGFTQRRKDRQGRQGTPPITESSSQRKSLHRAPRFLKLGGRQSDSSRQPRIQNALRIESPFQLAIAIQRLFAEESLDVGGA